MSTGTDDTKPSTVLCPICGQSAPVESLGFGFKIFGIHLVKGEKHKVMGMEFSLPDLPCENSYQEIKEKKTV